MRIVIDTNVVISAFLSPSGAPAQVLSYLEQDAFELLVSDPILDEYLRSLSYPKLRALHGMDDDSLEQVVNDLRSTAIAVESIESLKVVAQDPDDDKFFECAVAGDASYIVSGDTGVQAVGEYRGIRVVSPAMFVALLSNGLA